MKRQFLAVALLGASVSVNAQSRAALQGRTLDHFTPAVTTVPESLSPRGGGSFWEETFDGATPSGNNITTANGEWVVSGPNGNVWKHTFSGTNGCWSAGIPNPSFATAADGYLIFDADSANCANPNSNPPAFNATALTGSITSPAIDLSGVSDVLLEFSSATRWCCQDAPLFVSVSGDGGQTWSANMPVTAPALNTNQQAATRQFNVSSIIGNASQAHIRFSWTNGIAYYWAVDDIRLVLPEEHSLLLDFGYISHIVSSEEYGRVPSYQLLPEMLFGGMVRNFGYADQGNVQLSVDIKNPSNVTVQTGSENIGILSSPDTAYIDMLLGTGPLAEGRYTATFQVTSDNVTGGSGTSRIRRFEVTEGMYSLDGIGVHVQSQQVVSDLGNNSFDGSDVDFMMMTYYELVEPMTVSGIEIMFAQGTQVNGAIFVSIHDTLDIFMDNVDNPLAESDIYDITQQNVTTRRGRVYFDSPVELEPGGYYAAVRMLSDADEEVIRIQDDETVPQPFWASLIYHSGQASIFTNGNAFGIRLLDESFNVGIEDRSLAFAGLNAYPNPVSNGQLTIDLDAERTEVLNLSVLSVTGAEVLSQSLSVMQGSNRHQLDVEGLPSGLYLIRLSGAAQQSTLRVVVQH